MGQIEHDLIVVSIKRPWLELSKALPVFAKLERKRCFRLIANSAKIDFYTNSEFFLVSLKFSFLLRIAR